MMNIFKKGITVNGAEPISSYLSKNSAFRDKSG